MTQQKPDALIWGLLILLGIIWGGSFPAVTVALDGFGPLMLAAGRIVLGALALLVLTLSLGYGLPPIRSAIGRRIWLHALGTAVFFTSLPFALLGWGQQYVTAGFAGITMAVVPLFLLPMAHFMIPGEQLTRAKAFGFMLGFAGVVVLIGPSVLSSTGAEIETFARLACVAAAACYATANIITRLAPPCPQLAYSAATLVLAALLIVPMALFFEPLPQAPSNGSIAALIYLGLLPTALATIILVKIINAAGPSFLVLVNFQVPIWAAMMGMFFLSESLKPQFILALGLILAGLAISQRRKSIS